MDSRVWQNCLWCLSPLILGPRLAVPLAGGRGPWADHTLKSLRYSQGSPASGCALNQVGRAGGQVGRYGDRPRQCIAARVAHMYHCYILHTQNTFHLGEKIPGYKMFKKLCLKYRNLREINPLSSCFQDAQIREDVR